MDERAVQRFWKKVDKKEDDVCWNWARPASPYGQFWFEGGNVGAHRFAFAIANGALPALQVLHRCDNKRCVNPKHLFAGTQLDNMQDKVSKKRQAVGSKHGKSVLDEQKVAEIRKLRTAGMTLMAIASQFKVHYTTVAQIVSGKTWRLA